MAGLAVVMALGMVATASAQERQEKAKPQTPLKLQLVVSRYQGEKKISSLPYQLWVTTNAEGRTNLRMTVRVYVPSSSGPASQPGAPPVNFEWKDVGTSIDCSATEALETGVYKISVLVSDSSLYNVPGGQRVPQDTVVATPPSSRNFMASFTILLRDGQTAQYTSATDPVSGEVLKIDATLNVLK